jgi:hypothetical protein
MIGNTSTDTTPDVSEPKAVATSTGGGVMLAPARICDTGAGDLSPTRADIAPHDRLREPLTPNRTMCTLLFNVVRSMSIAFLHTREAGCNSRQPGAAMSLRDKHVDVDPP